MHPMHPVQCLDHIEHRTEALHNVLAEESRAHSSITDSMKLLVERSKSQWAALEETPTEATKRIEAEHSRKVQQLRDLQDHLENQREEQQKRVGQIGAKVGAEIKSIREVILDEGLMRQASDENGLMMVNGIVDQMQEEIVGEVNARKASDDFILKMIEDIVRRHKS